MFNLDFPRWIYIFVGLPVGSTFMINLEPCRYVWTEACFRVAMVTRFIFIKSFSEDSVEAGGPRTETSQNIQIAIGSRTLEDPEPKGT